MNTDHQLLFLTRCFLSFKIRNAAARIDPGDMYKYNMLYSLTFLSDLDPPEEVVIPHKRTVRTTNAITYFKHVQYHKPCH